MFSSQKIKRLETTTTTTTSSPLLKKPALYVTEVVKGVEAAYKYIEKEALDGQRIVDSNACDFCEPFSKFFVDGRIDLKKNAG